VFGAERRRGCIHSPLSRRITGVHIRTLALPLLLAGALVACGDDDAADTDTTASPPTTAATATTTAMTDATAMSDSTGAGGGADIVDTVVGAGDFSTLVTAVQAAGLEETLRGEGPFTVFAPTDAAFAALPTGTVDTLLADPTGDLAGILTYHVVGGEVVAADVAGMDGQQVTTVNGASFTINVGDDGTVTLTDAAGNEIGVVQTDVDASNGVIHVIDGVLLPG
jgi:uncharacterized surface protein with fasciclin (FAS1) repeats